MYVGECLMIVYSWGVLGVFDLEMKMTMRKEEEEGRKKMRK